MGNKQAVAARAEEMEEPDIEEVAPETHTKQSEGTKTTGHKKAAEQGDTTTTEEAKT